MRQMTALGRNIENESFKIIDREAGDHSYSSKEWEIVRRVIHATADFEFKSLMEFSPMAVTDGIAALEASSSILVDVKMIEAGLNQSRLDHFGCSVHHYISDEDVIEKAKAKNSTRAVESMQKALEKGVFQNSIIAVGNAPTALLEAVRIIRETHIKPALIIGVPVGFVSAPESKEAVCELKDVPYIVSRGRKGGSAIAVSILHALMKLSVEGESNA
ncbi:MAG: precorrin-8X methylmutase [Spirochaetia bacterium]|nr:precorrin-8X methylmutase [Spirochaetia bacterium]